VDSCGKGKAEIQSPAPLSSTVNRSKRVPFVAQRRATMRGKKIWGRKRHVLVEKPRHLLGVKVTGADDSDLQGAKRLLEPVKERFGRLKLLWGESHYGGTLIEWIEQHLGWTVEVVRGLVTIKHTEQNGEMMGDKERRPSGGGFQILPRRWVVERSLAWITRGRRLARDHEGRPESSEAFSMLSASRRMLSLLAPPFP